MKEAFWGALIVVLGLFGIVVINIFQNVTTDNDQIYYLIKETTEASALDSLDLTNYRLTGTIRMVEDKFIENLTRRFAENVTIGDYTIVVEDINELPPKISLRVRSGITSLKGEEFGIVNRVDGIIETKYSLNEVLEFLDITEEEWIEHSKGAEEDWNSEGERTCKVRDNEEPQCLSGDLRFLGFGDVELPNAICKDEIPPSNVKREAKYQECKCGTWEDKSEYVFNDTNSLYGSGKPTNIDNSYYEYSWKFRKVGKVRTIEANTSSKVDIQVCTTKIEEWIPKDINNIPNIQELIEAEKAYEPSTNNDEYMICPAEGIRIPIGLKVTLHPNYIPSNSINRKLTWKVEDESILSIQSANPAINCVLNSDFTNCLSKATITAKSIGTTYVNVQTTRGQTATCKVEVWDGKVETMSCEDLTLSYNGSETPIYSYSPLDAINPTFKWSISDTSVAEIDENTGKVTAQGKVGSAIITMTSEEGKSATCKVKVNSPPPVDDESCSILYENEMVGKGLNTTPVTKECDPVQYNSCSACGYKKCQNAVCGFKSCSACGYKKCQNAACGYATCQNKDCGTECVKRIMGVCVERQNKTCQTAACGYATCQTTACGYASCNKCGIAECYNEVCGYASCNKCGTKECTYEPGTTNVLIKSDVTYSGYKYSETISGTCSNGTKKITINTYCKVSRTRYYLNTGKEYQKLISTESYETGC